MIPFWGGVGWLCLKKNPYYILVASKEGKEIDGIVLCSFYQSVELIFSKTYLIYLYFKKKFKRRRKRWSEVS